MALIVKRFRNFRFRRNLNFKFKSNCQQDFREVVLRPQIAQEEATKLGWLTEVRFVASTIMRWGTLPLNARSLGNSRILLMMSVRSRRHGKAYLAEGKSRVDSESEDEEVGNLALMAISDNPSSSKPQVTFTDTEMIYHLSGTLDCARHENDRLILLE